MTKSPYRRRKNMAKFCITLVNLLLFNYLFIYADKFQVKVETAPVKASFLQTTLAAKDSSSVVLDNVIIDDSRYNGNITYVIKPGDSLDIIAQNVGTTVDNIRRVNNISSNETVRADGTIVNKDGIAISRLTISELPGIVVAMGTKTSVAEFAKQYNVSEDDIKSLNNIADSKTILQAGDELFLTINEKEAIKKGIIEDPNPPVIATPTPTETTSKPTTKNNPTKQTETSKPTTPVKPQTTTPTKQTATPKATIVATEGLDGVGIDYDPGTVLSSWFQKDGGYAGFAAGYCTSYAAAKRPDIFTSSKAFRGNANAWLRNAAAAGNATGKTPKVGSIAVYSPGRGASSYGHVAIVEKVDESNGTIVVSDMNYKGRFIVTKRVVSASLAAGYIY